MAPNQVDFENLYFNSFYNEHFSDTEDERDPDENFFNVVNTQNFECFYLLPNELKVLSLRKKILKLLMQSIKT